METDCAPNADDWVWIVLDGKVTDVFGDNRALLNGEVKKWKPNIRPAPPKGDKS